LIETDIWPGFLAELRRLRVPCFLLNARLSPASFRFSRLLSPLLVPAFDTFARIYPQSPEEAQRFLELGLETRKIHPAGNLKFDLADPLPSLATVRERRRGLGIGEAARVILAGSTHPGEEAILRTAFLVLRHQYPQLKLVVAPRHPHRAAEVERLFRNDILRVVRTSERPVPEAEVIVVDQLGLLGSLYAVADVAFVGGSLVNKGGQNPIEPAAAGRPILFGRDMSDFPEVSRLLLESGGAIQVRNPDDLIEHCGRLLADRHLADEAGAQARTVVDQHQGASARIAADITVFLKL
jgi:3-deoxy-D-manno-octulosonic-acid transferase